MQRRQLAGRFKVEQVIYEESRLPFGGGCDLDRLKSREWLRRTYLPSVSQEGLGEFQRGRGMVKLASSPPSEVHSQLGVRKDLQLLFGAFPFRKQFLERILFPLKGLSCGPPQQISLYYTKNNKVSGPAPIFSVC